MKVEWRSAVDLDGPHGAEFRTIAAESKSAPFADLEVLQAWAASLDDDRQVRVGFAVDDGELCGVLALSHTEALSPAGVWHLWGETVDFGVIWAATERAHECWHLWLADLPHLGIEQVTFRNLRLGDPVVSALLQVAPERDHKLHLLDRRQAPYIDLTPGYDGWLDTRTKSQRRQYRRADRAFESLPDSTLELINEPALLAATLPSFIELHLDRRARLGRTSIFDDDTATRFLSELVRLWGPAGRLKVLVARSAGEVVGVELLIVTDQTWYSLNGGWNGDFAAYHVGTGLLLAAMRTAHAAGARRYSLLEGEQPYKLRMATGGQQLASWNLRLTNGPVSDMPPSAS